MEKIIYQLLEKKIKRKTNDIVEETLENNLEKIGDFIIKIL